MENLEEIKVLTIKLRMRFSLMNFIIDSYIFALVMALFMWIDGRTLYDLSIVDAISFVFYTLVMFIYKGSSAKTIKAFVNKNN